MSKRIITRNSNKIPPYGSRIDPHHPLSQGLELCLLFNEGGGNTVHNLAYVDKGNLVNGPVWTPDGGVRTDGATNYILVTDEETDRYTKNEFTLELSLAIHAFTRGEIVCACSKWHAGIGLYGWKLYEFNSGTDFLFITKDYSGVVYIPYTLGQPFTLHVKHYAGDTNVYGYSNGIHTGTAVVNELIEEPSTNFTVGCSSTLDAFSDITIYRLRYWSRALSDGEIMEAYSRPYGNIIYSDRKSNSPHSKASNLFLF